jgi:hypothetical protein
MTPVHSPLISALSVLPLSELERSEVIRHIDTGKHPLSENGQKLAERLLQQPMKKTATLGSLLSSLQTWAEGELEKNDLALLHSVCEPVENLAIANIGITIICNSYTRQTRLKHAAHLLLGAILGYFRIPIALRVMSSSEISYRTFLNGTVLVHGSQVLLDEIFERAQKEKARIKPKTTKPPVLFPLQALRQRPSIQ